LYHKARSRAIHFVPSFRGLRAFTEREIGINNRESGQRISVAQRANVEREQITRGQESESVRANRVSYEGQMKAINIQHQAASQAARLHALSSIITSVGSTVASQAQGAFTQFNRM
jgi:hypothetical protein